MEDNFQHLILGRLHEVSQLYVDRVVRFMVSAAYRDLNPTLQLQLLDALEGASSSLRRHTMSVLGVAGQDLRSHLPELFTTLAHLSELCGPLGVPPMSFVFEMYRRRLIETGLTYLAD